jgi:ABC-2 type transport system ATP-binding protein
MVETGEKSTNTLHDAISVRSLVKSYGERRAVDELSFSVWRGEIFALLGPNGAGKTTTVEMLEGYRTPDAGEVRVLGLDPIRDGAELKQRIGVMLQSAGVYPTVTPLEILNLFHDFYRDAEDPKKLIELVGLEESANTRFRQLSGGQQRRLALASALIGKPELLFLDEPTTAMDPQARHMTWEILQTLRDRGLTILLNDLRVGHESLEEVFLRLTGHELRE